MSKRLKFIDQYIIVRKAKGMTQEDVAVKLGISVSHLSKIESGTRNPSGNTLAKLAFAVGGELSLTGW